MKERLLDRINEAARGFFIIVTLINIAMYILGRIFQPGVRFGYEAFIYPVVYGLITSLPHLIMGDERVMTVKQVVVQKTVQLTLIIIILLIFIFGGNPVNARTIPMMAGVATSAVVIYIGVHTIIWFFDYRSAQHMTQELIEFQHKGE